MAPSACGKLARLLRARQAGMWWRKPQSQAFRERRKAKPSAAQAPLALEPSQSQSSGQRKKKQAPFRAAVPNARVHPVLRWSVYARTSWMQLGRGAGQSRGHSGPGVESGLLLPLGSWRLVADGVHLAPNRKMPAATWVVNWKKEGGDSDLNF